MFVELDTRQNGGLVVSLEWERETDRTQIVVTTAWDESQIVVAVPGASAGDALRNPFRYLP